ncbi:MAG TPA: flagellin [Dongiaceae bacterium]|nr:flagellin [Dongiaceae bacterium]
MTTTVATHGIYQSVLNFALNVQQRLATTTVQESSGLVSTQAAGLGTSSARLLNLQGELSSAERWSANASLAGDRVQVMYSAVGNMVDLASSLKSAIAAAMSGTDTGTTADTLRTAAQDALDDLADQMNVQLGGRYLFSGSDTDIAPVDLTDYPSTTPPSATTADTGYYQGDDQLAAISVSAETRITYGVAGSAGAFETVLRAAALAASASSSDPVDSDALSSAYDLVTTAISKLSALQEGLSNTAGRLTEAKASQDSFSDYLKTMVSDIKNVDAAETMTRVTELQTQLEASYSAVSAILKLRLTDYL